MPAETSGLELEIERVLPAGRSAVFDAFTRPELLSRWWGPRGFTTPHVDFAPVPGRSYRIEMAPPEGPPFHLIGEVRRADPPARLAYSFAWEPPDPDDVVTEVQLAFRGTGDATEVTLRQGPFTTPAREALHRDGWTQSLDRLAALLSRG